MQVNAGHASTRIRSGYRVSHKRPGRVRGETCEKHLNTCSKRMFHFFPLVRWPEPVYMRVGYVFDLRFSE